MKNYALAILMALALVLPTVSKAQDLNVVGTQYIEMQCIDVKDFGNYLKQYNEKIMYRMVSITEAADGKLNSYETIVSVNHSTKEWTMMRLLEEHNAVCLVATGTDFESAQKLLNTVKFD